MTTIPMVTDRNSPSACDAFTANDSWHLAGDDASNTAAKHTSKPRIASGKRSARQPHPADGADAVMPSSTQLAGKGNSHVRRCDWCGEEFVTHRPWGRFCCATHRANYWYAQREELEGQ